MAHGQLRIIQRRPLTVHYDTVPAAGQLAMRQRVEDAVGI